MSSSTLTDLQIVPSTVKLSDKETRNKYFFARSKGVIKCPTGKVMFLGDRGVGKTCTKRMLLGKEHVSEHVSTLGIRNHVTETRQVDEDWKEITSDSLKDYEGSELKRAFAYFVAFVDNHIFIQSVSEKFKEKLGNVVKFFLSLLVISLLCYGMTLDEGRVIYYTPVLLSCCLGTYTLTRDLVIGFSIGNGYAILVVFVYFWSMETNSLFAAWFPEATRLIFLALLAAFSGWLIGFVLALGIGAGLSIAFCLMQHNPESETVIFSSKETKSVYGAVAFATFMLSIFIAITVQSLGFHRSSKWVRNIIAPAMFILSVLLAKAFTEGLTLTHFYLSGFLFGTAFIFGQIHGRMAALKVHLGHTNRMQTDILGFVLGVIFGYVLSWTPIELSWWLPVGILGVTFCLVCEVHRYNVKRRDVVPVGLIRKMKDEGKKGWPTKLHLLDCAGNSIYHNTHHIFMSRNSIYLVVFRLDQLRDDPDLCNERILYWLNSVVAHARHGDSKIFLVATHKMRVPDEIERQELLKELSESLRRSFCGRLVKNMSKNHYVFAVENDEREYNDEDVQLLKSEIWDKAMTAEYTNLPNRVTWFAFLDKVREIKRKSQPDDSHNYEVIHKCKSLWELVKDDCHLKKDTDFYRMLRYFHDCGEIFYDCRDPILCRYVILDPQLMVDVVSALLQCESAVQNLPDRLENDHEDLKTTGVVTFRLLAHYLKNFKMDTRKLVHLLKSLDILIPLTVTSGLLCEESDKYVVTFMLPLRRVERMKIRNPDRIVIFDFGYFYPEPVFLRLLAKCYQMSFSTTRGFSFRVTEENIFISKDKGIFYFANGIQYCIQLFRPNSKSNQIWIQIKALQSEHLAPDVFDFIEQMDALMKRICDRYFEFLEYKYLMVCDCSMDLLRDIENDTPPADIDTIPIVNYSRSGNQNVESFPKSSQTYLCNKDVNLIVRFNPSATADVSKMRSDPEYNIPDLQERADAFISCCPQDRIFVQTDIVPFLENDTKQTLGIRESVSVLVNYYDNPNANASHWTAQSINKELIKQCKCVIAICSLNYLSSAELKDAQLAAMEEIPVIPVYIQDVEPPLHFPIVSSIHYPLQAELLTIDFYVPLIRTVRYHCDKDTISKAKSSFIPKMIKIFGSDGKNKTEEEPVIL